MSSLDSSRTAAERPACGNRGGAPHAGFMKVLIVAKTRRGAGACVGGITESGQSVRLIAHDTQQNEHAGLEYEVGEVWEIDSAPDPQIIPPHVENIIVQPANRLRR